MATKPEHPDLDRAEIIAALDRHHVDYILVGGVATIAHGATRPTFDFDCLPRDSDDNLDRLAAALKELGARLRADGLDDEVAKSLPVPMDGRWLASMEILTFRTNHGDLDVLTDLPAADGTRRRYDDIASRAEQYAVDGITIRVASLDDIIASKEWADRPKDRDALPELYRLAQDRDRP